MSLRSKPLESPPGGEGRHRLGQAIGEPGLGP